MESAEETFTAQEARECTRMSWNVWPNTRLETAKMVVPLSATVQPAKAVEHLPVLPYGPVQCKTCHLALNCYCEVDFTNLLWSCPHCASRNQLPQQYAGISPSHLPPELFPEYQTVEYSVGASTTATPLAFVFVLDSCLPEDELSSAKESIEQVLNLLPPNGAVSLIVFDRNVCLYELSGSSNGFTRSVLFYGGKEMSGESIRAMLNFGRRSANASTTTTSSSNAMAGFHSANDPSSRFVCMYSECELTLEQVLEELRPSPVESAQGHRQERAVGNALNVATTLMEMYTHSRGGRVMLFTGGPPTLGPGQIVDTDRSSELRTHHDFDKGNTKFFKSAKQHYDALAKRLGNEGCALDVFACSMDQCGVSEMKDAIDCTGGMVVLAESFASDNYRRTLNHLFSSDENDNLHGCYDGHFTALAPREVKINGAIGPVSKGVTPKHYGMCVPSEIELGVGGTTTWRLPTFREGTTLSVYMEVANTQANAVPVGSALVLQFQCVYFTATGERRLRVITVARTWAASSNGEVMPGFDQAAAAVAIARHVAFKAENDEPFDIMRWLDRQLIRLCSKYGEYTNDQPDSFSLMPNFALFPQFLFNLRRSQFLQVFNNVPDETAYFRLMLCRETVDNTVLMMQPSLMRYSMDSGEPQPVLLDIRSVELDVTLMLDTYFLVLVHYGSHVAAWRNAGYHLDPQYDALREIIERPQKEAQEIEKTRFPTPTVKNVDQNTSQARFLIAKLNPSATHESADTFDETMQYINTDDASFETFLSHLKKIAVST